MGYSNWQQTQEYTCGAASLMVAMHELIESDISETKEMEIWNYVHPFCYSGSMPGYLAIYAQKTKKLQAKIFHSPARCSQLLNRLPLAFRCLYKMLLLINAWSLWCAKSHKVNIQELQGDDQMNTILDLAKSQKDSRILVVIEVEEYELHYILLRHMSKDSFLIMDPAFGENMTLSRQVFMDNYKHADVGFYLLLAKP